MQKALVLLVIMGLSGCAQLSFPGVYKIDVDQGNIVTQAQVDQLRPGMTRKQVRYVLGSPLVEDSFHQARWDYLYTLKPGKGPRTGNRLSLFFQGDQLVRFSGDWAPGGTGPAPTTTGAE